jgi:hypothetical protein
MKMMFGFGAGCAAATEAASGSSKEMRRQAGRCVT